MKRTPLVETMDSQDNARSLAGSSSFEPQFQGPIEGYVVNYLKRHFWRVESSMDYADVMQEAYLLFLHLKAQYPYVDTPQWFMSLFKRSFSNLMDDLSVVDSRLREIPPLSAVCGGEEGPDYENTLECLQGDSDNVGMLSLMIRQAPQEIKSVLSLFLNAPPEILELAWGVWSRKRGNKGNENDLLGKWLGLPPGTDVIGPVREYFSN